MSQATLSERPYVNSNLFSGHYLDERVADREEWDCDEAAREAMAALADLYELEGDLVEGYNEDALIDNWIAAVLDELGYGTSVETTLPDGDGFVDVLLFEDPGTRREAASVYLDTGDSTDLFDRGVGLVEAKQWDADFTERFSEGRPYRNASHQVKHYLEKTPGGIDWGILTNGRKWRIYGTKDYETETYFEVDLPELLERGDLEAFKYFYVFFRPAAFRASAGTTFLDAVHSESETAAQELGEDLQDNVFTALRVLGRGFVETNDLAIDPDDDGAMDELKEQSLVLLYRLMFVLYAEGRGLIHPEGPAARAEYEENFSLDQLRLEVHEEVGEVDEGFADEFSDHSTTMWSRLEDLFRLIDEGEADLGIPPYNGGLFDREAHDFLAENEVSNRYLAEVVYRLSTTRNDEGRYVLADYGDLDTRHLGSVYEGLLEHQFRIAPEEYAAVAEDGGQVWKPATEVTVAEAVETVPEGGLYVVNDEGERKATGAYYTPDYVVTYIVEETVGPLVDGIREDLVDQGFERGTQEYLGPFIRRITDLNILDPAMGSGHFLTKATGYLAREVMSEYREIESELGRAFNEESIRRDIAKECIYGVDLNGMAVELAKLSMWLETLAADRPLAFLDHHFKQGNSLVGSDIESIEELESDASDEDAAQASLAEFGATREGTIERLMEIYSEFLAIENESITDIDEMKRKYAEIERDDLRQRLVAMANVHTAERFDLDVPSGAYERMARALEDDGEWAEVEDSDWFRTAQAMAGDHDFFHWKLAFPEVFYDEDGSIQSDAGFDVIVGNPPWLNAWRMTEEIPEQREYIKNNFDSTGLLEGHWDLFIPFSIRAIQLARDGGLHSFIVPNLFLTEKYAMTLRKNILKDHSLESILSFSEYNVFKGVERQSVIYTISIADKSDNCCVLRTCLGVEPFSAEKVSEVDDSIWLDTYNFQIRVDPDYVKQHLPIIRTIDANSNQFGQYFYVNIGATVSSKLSGEFTKDDVVSDSPTGNAKRFFQGSDVDRWKIKWRENWLDYRQEEMSGPRHPEMFEAEKIVVRKRTDEGGVIAAAHDDEGMYCDDTVIVCCNYDALDATNATTEFEGFKRKDDDPDLKYILALLNSTLMTWLFKNKFETGGLQGTYSDVWPQSVRSFPVPKIINDNYPLAEWEQRAVDISLRNNNKISPTDDPERLLSILADVMIQTKENRGSVNLNLLDYIQPYSEGPTLTEVGRYQPPEGVGNSMLTDTAADRDNLRIGTVAVERDGPGTVTVTATARYKPADEDAHETDQYGYTETDPMPAMVLSDLTELEADLVAAFVPVAAGEAGGFAGFRDNATKTISPVDRLESLTLPDPGDVAEGLERYREARDRAAELDAKIERTDELIDEIVYDLYGLTEEEIAIVEEAVE